MGAHFHIQFKPIKGVEMATIDTEIVFDVSAILNAYVYKQSSPVRSTAENPIPIWHQDIYMVAPSIYLQDRDSQATADLNIRATIGDQIRWAGITFSSDIKYCAVIYDIFLTDRGPRKNEWVTSKPTPKVATPNIPVPDVNPKVMVNGAPVIDPLKFTPRLAYEYYLSCDVLSPGEEHYSIRFYITEQVYDGKLNVIGYFQWDPVITVN
ncbi:inclusion body family protein [Burkholderia sp. S-53]|uniref:inclusion body family protein n=1 Tax=Burkholderia sp. S-53 TaxID=2906514 RepID=UPI0021D1E183|nr:inclusion body family protein [Burkholderia sp. S-53]UXU88887.1 inclusion body family protein [Burkholderia sp. S-53]